MTTLEDIAQVCHEANRAYCLTLGDRSQLPWNDAPEWQRESAIDGVSKIAYGSVTKPEDSHESWCMQKYSENWNYGPVKDPVKKEHPCLVPFADLPPEQQMKDHIFFAIATAMLENFSR